MEDTKIITMPVIALRGLTMLPEMTISFDICLLYTSDAADDS